MSDTAQGKTFDVDSIPEDAKAYATPPKEYAPLPDGEAFQVEIKEIVLKENTFYKEPAPGKKPEGSKYVFGITLVILDEGEYRGRRIWENASPVLKPEGKKGASKLFKIVTKAMNTNFDWDMCGSFAADMKVLYKNLKQNVEGQQLRVTIESSVNPETKKNKVKVAVYSSVKSKLPTYVSEAEKEQQATDALVKNVEDALVKQPKGKKESVDTEDIPF